MRLFIDSTNLPDVTDAVVSFLSLLPQLLVLILVLLLLLQPFLPQISWTKDDLPLEERSSDSGQSTVRISRNGLLVIEVRAGKTINSNFSLKKLHYFKKFNIINPGCFILVCRLSGMAWVMSLLCLSFTVPLDSLTVSTGDHPKPQLKPGLNLT